MVVPARAPALSFDDLRRLKYYLLTARALADPREPVDLSHEEIRAKVSLEELVTIAADLLQALQTLADPLLAFDVVDSPIGQRKTCQASIDSLTPMQVRVLALVATGKMNKQIAWELGISEQTVKGHVSTILKRLGARTRTHAASIASAQAIILK